MTAAIYRYFDVLSFVALLVVMGAIPRLADLISRLTEDVYALYFWTWAIIYFLAFGAIPRLLGLIFWMATEATLLSRAARRKFLKAGEPEDRPYQDSKVP